MADAPNPRGNLGRLGKAKVRSNEYFFSKWDRRPTGHFGQSGEARDRLTMPSRCILSALKSSSLLVAQASSLCRLNGGRGNPAPTILFMILREPQAHERLSWKVCLPYR